MNACAVLLWALQAVPSPGPPIAVDALQPTDTQGHVFSGQEVRLTLRVYGGQGRRLDLRARPYQLAHTLAMPVGPELEVATDAALGSGAWHDFSFAFGCPAVERNVRWELRFLARMDGGEVWQDAGRADLELHPPDLLAALRRGAREAPWFVSDGPGALKAFLIGAGIPFRDLDLPSGRDAWARAREALLARGSPSARAGALIVCVRPSGTGRNACAEAALEDAPRALVFEEALHSFALRSQQQQTRVMLDIEWISRLGHDPRAQLALAEAIELLRHDPVPCPGPSDG